MKILITGASGFIGSFIVEEALRRGFETWAAVRKSSSREYLKDERIKFIELNLSSKAQLVEQLRGKDFDYVVHAAGVTKCLNKQDFHRINTEGTKNLADALIETGMPLKRFIFVSSLSIFGAIREQQPYTEILDTDTPQPNTAYGESKLAAEQWLREQADVSWVVLRPTGVYGPRERDYFLMAQSIAQHVDFSVGYQRQEITFVYVRDVVEAVLLACEREGVEHKAFFLSDGEVYTSSDFSDLLQKEIGVRGVLHVKAPLWVLRAVCAVNGGVCSRLGRLTTLNMDKYHILAQRNWRCDITPARELLGFDPQWQLARGVEETVAWYKREGWL